MIKCWNCHTELDNTPLSSAEKSVYNPHPWQHNNSTIEFSQNEWEIIRQCMIICMESMSEIPNDTMNMMAKIVIDIQQNLRG